MIFNRVSCYIIFTFQKYFCKGLTSAQPFHTFIRAFFIWRKKIDKKSLNHLRFQIATIQNLEENLFTLEENLFTLEENSY